MTTLAAVRIAHRSYRGFLVSSIAGSAAVCLSALAPHPSVPARYELARIQVDMLAREYYPRWVVAHPSSSECPRDALDVRRASHPDAVVADVTDPWGRRLYSFCVMDQFLVFSLGEDGLAGTADDVRSWQR